MSDRIRSHESSETPIERIFQKVMHRKMTPQERVYFHLKPAKPQPPGKSPNGAGSEYHNGAKAARN